MLKSLIAYKLSKLQHTFEEAYFGVLGVTWARLCCNYGDLLWFIVKTEEIIFTIMDDETMRKVPYWCDVLQMCLERNALFLIIYCRVLCESSIRFTDFYALPSALDRKVGRELCRHNHSMNVCNFVEFNWTSQSYGNNLACSCQLETQLDLMSLILFYFSHATCSVSLTKFINWLKQLAEQTNRNFSLLSVRPEGILMLCVALTVSLQDIHGSLAPYWHLPKTRGIILCFVLRNMTVKIIYSFKNPKFK